MEIEAKFIIQDTQTYHDLQAMDRLGRFSISASRVEDMRDTYLDTPDRRLLRSGYACRQREQEGSAMIALKSLHGVDGAIHRREEVEAPLAQIETPPEHWPDSAARQRVLALIDPLMQLQPLLHLEQRRVVREVLYAQRLVAELSLDTVTSHDHVYYELEIELKGAGTERDLVAIVDKLARMPGLTPEPRSKFERALAALDMQDMARQPADGAPGIVADDSMAEAARKTLRFHMRRMAENEAGTRAGVDIEALHDMRVATRRMRTAFYVFADAIDARAIDAGATAPYLKELKRAGRVLGRVRDLDVFREKAQAYLGAFAKSAAPDLTPLMRAWDTEYARARAKLLKHLDSERYARFKHAFTMFLETPLSPVPTSTAAQRVAAAVPDLIAARLGEFYACKTRLDQPDADLTDYHQMRIVTKYLRYTLEYFREVLGAEGEQAIAELKVLQNHLGALQDAVVASAHLQNVVAWGTWRRPAEEHLRWTPTPIAAPDVAAYLEFQQAESRRLVRTFPEAWAHYEGVDGNAAITALSSQKITFHIDKERLMTQNPKFVILLGPPAAGKGTQATRLSEHLHLPHVASGDLFRYNLKNETELGRQAKTYMDRGALVPDDLTIAMVLDRLSRPDCAAGALLDGFPRTLAQAEALDRALAEKGLAINGVLNIIVPDEALIERVTGRRLCRACGEPYHIKFNPPKKEGVCDIDGGELYQRDDDNKVTVANRLKVYWDQTSPLIGYYKKTGALVDIDGNLGIDAVTEALKAAVASL